MLKFTFIVRLTVTLDEGTNQQKEEEQMQLVIDIKDGASNKDIAHQLRWQANLLEGMEPKEAASTKNTSASKPVATPVKKSAAPTPAPAAVEDDDDFQSATEETNGFDDDDSEPVAEASFDDAAPDDEEEKPAPKKAAPAKGQNGKAKKITLDDVNDACKAHAAAKGRPATLAVLQKKFKTQSVTALKPEQYETCIAAMAVN